MNLILTRKERRADGIFSELADESGRIVAVTLEHSYENEPKIPNGRFQCVRGVHQLHSGPPFETFEITGVPGHSNLLFHQGNWNRDSEGCILLGQAIQVMGGTQMIVHSKDTFRAFMELQKEVQEFQLTVVG